MRNKSGTDGVITRIGIEYANIVFRDTNGKESSDRWRKH